MTTAQRGTTAPERETAPGYALALGALFLLSGVLALLYEVVWFRRLPRRTAGEGRGAKP